MKKNKIYFLLLFALALISTTALSQKVGSTSMQFLKVMPCARATALGDAYSVWASGAEAVFWNPGGIVSAEQPEFSFTYIKWIFDTRQGAMSFATSLGSFGAIGLQLQYVDFGEIEETKATRPIINKWPDPGLTGNTFHPFSYLAGITYAARLTDRFSTGLTIKYAHESLYNGSRIIAMTDNLTGETMEVKTWADVILFDYGFRYNTGFRSIEVAASVQNFGPTITYAKDASNAPLALRVGIAANILGPEALLFASKDNRIGMAFELFQPNDYNQQAHLGLEYEFLNMVALRMGYKFNYDADGFTAGGGVKQKIGSMRLSLDYSVGALSYNLGNVHRISLGVGF